jgi:hypothetical protein
VTPGGAFARSKSRTLRTLIPENVSIVRVGRMALAINIRLKSSAVGLQSNRTVQTSAFVVSRRSIARVECCASGRADAFEASFMNGRSWRKASVPPSDRRIPTVPGPIGNGGTGVVSGHRRGDRYATNRMDALRHIAEDAKTVGPPKKGKRRARGAAAADF